MIIFSLIMFFNVKISLFFNFFDPFVYFFWILVADLLFVIFHFFCLLFFFPYFFCWGGLGYIFGCDLISYGLVLLSLWICVLMILARESVFQFGYFSGFFLFLLCIHLRTTAPAKSACAICWAKIIRAPVSSVEKTLYYTLTLK